ncbi:hypothetical protein C8R41DRAFT_926558 [Lentinula lateritia]|uniref:Uncharacterized protein n=1 Tax=Lentinula lateritia TaxID=40482 RepID=A0ABQ8V2L8_9AGAR|nr:hypothetical protein C8R41DRAFT_926558 [Lentinula lateritia]
METTASTKVSVPDLRHVTSSGALSPATTMSPSSNSPTSTTRGRLSQHYGLGLGLGSPLGSSSIPSSPTSVHSSSSAIFERDIEAPTTTTTSTTNATRPNPHHIARGHTTETLDQNVPSVLDSAAEILAAGKGDNVLVIESVTTSGSGWASPRSMGSRSPSPSPLGQGSLLLGVSGAGAVSTSPPRPTIATSLSSPSKSPPTTIAATSPDDDASSDEPLTTKRDTVPDYPWFSPHSHSPPHTLSTKRLSFVSYSDLLTSTPTLSLPLSTLTAAANEPPHIATVGNALEGLAHTHPTHPNHPPISTSPPSSPLSTPTPLGFGYDHTSSSRSPSLAYQRPSTPGSGSASRSRSNRASAVFLDDLLGGEWQREGLGRGLEERLEGTPTTVDSV